MHVYYRMQVTTHSNVANKPIRSRIETSRTGRCSLEHTDASTYNLNVTRTFLPNSANSIHSKW